MQIAVIGGGAAGFFAALSCKHHYPEAKVTIYEKSDKLLSKVKVSGGGRCNVTHSCFSINDLVKFYPRGERPLKKAFGIFNPNDTVEWFRERGVELKTEEDGRMFPVTDSSQTIIDCLMDETRKTGIGIKTQSPIRQLLKVENGYHLVFKNGDIKFVDHAIVATGGSPREKGFDWLKILGHSIKKPVPSLFTFNMPDESITKLMGVVANPVIARVQGTKLRSEGPLLITHWGMSGPAVLKLSAYGARILNEMEYNFTVLIQWVGEKSEAEIREILQQTIFEDAKKKLTNVNPFGLPNRLWEHLLQKLEPPEVMIWENFGKKNLNRLVHLLCNDEYSVRGKTTFKEEFVTCGGISLSDVGRRGQSR